MNTINLDNLKEFDKNFKGPKNYKHITKFGKVRKPLKAKKGFKILTLEEKKAKISKRQKKYYRKKKKTTQMEVWGVKLWSVTKADSEYSKWLREKIGKCEKCLTLDGLTCSHYIGRREYCTRFDPDNTDVLCWKCHAEFEPRKQYEYRDWKIAKMGAEKEVELSRKKLGYKSSQQAIYDCMKLLGKI